MNLAVYTARNGRFITQAYTEEALWEAANISFRETGEVWLHGMLRKKEVDRGFTRQEFDEEILPLITLSL